MIESCPGEIRVFIYIPLVAGWAESDESGSGRYRRRRNLSGGF